MDRSSTPARHPSASTNSSSRAPVPPTRHDQQRTPHGRRAGEEGVPDSTPVRTPNDEDASNTGRNVSNVNQALYRQQTHNTASNASPLNGWQPHTQPHPAPPPPPPYPQLALNPFLQGRRSGAVSPQRIAPNDQRAAWTRHQETPFHEPSYYAMRHDHAVGAPEDFLHPSGVEAGRSLRVRGFHQMPGEDVQDSYPEAMADAPHVEYDVRSMGGFLPRPRAQARDPNVPSQDKEDSVYPPLD